MGSLFNFKLFKFKTKYDPEVYFRFALTQNWTQPKEIINEKLGNSVNGFIPKLSKDHLIVITEPFLNSTQNVLSTFSRIEGIGDGLRNALEQLDTLRTVYQSDQKHFETLQSMIQADLRAGMEYDRYSATQVIMSITSDMNFIKVTLDEFYAGRRDTQEILQVNSFDCTGINWQYLILTSLAVFR